MKRILIFLLLIFTASFVYGQSVDESIQTVCTQLAQRAVGKQITHIGILDFTNEQGQRDASVAYIQEQVELDLINANGLEVMDRKHIMDLLSENKLVSDGLIDESTVKKAVSFIKVDAWVVGEITNMGDVIKLKLKVVDVSSSQMFAAAMTNIDANEINKISAPKPCKYCNGTGQIKMLVRCATCKGTGGPTCPSCGGSGKDFISAGLGGNAPCHVCSGKGKIICQACNGKGITVTYIACSHCNGTGKSAE